MSKTMEKQERKRTLILAAVFAAMLLVLAACAPSPGGKGQNSTGSAGNAAVPGNTAEGIDGGALDVPPSITVDGVSYITPFMPTDYLPFGYAYMGELSKAQAGDSGLSGMPYFMAFGHDDIYVYQQTGVPVGLDRVDSTQLQWSYLRWVPQEKARPKENLMTLSDAVRLSNKRDALSWEDLARYKFTCAAAGAQAGSDPYIYTFWIDDAFCLQFVSEASEDDFAQGKVRVSDQNLKLIYTRGEDSADLFSPQIEDFINKYRVVDICDTNEVVAEAFEKFWEQDGWSFEFPEIRSENIFVITADAGKTKLVDALRSGLILITDLSKFGITNVYYSGPFGSGCLEKGLLPTEEIKPSGAAELIPGTAPSEENFIRSMFPRFTELDAGGGLTVVVWPAAKDAFTCSLYEGDVSMSWRSPLAGPVNPEYMQKILALYDIPDSSVTIRPYYPLPGYYAADRAAAEKEMSGQFRDRYKVGEEFKLFGPASGDRPLAALKALCPDYFELDTAEGLTVYFTSGGRSLLFSGRAFDAKDKVYYLYNIPGFKYLTVTEVKRIIDWYANEKGLSDRDIFVAPVKSDYDGLSRDDFSAMLKDVFGGRFEIGEY